MSQIIVRSHNEFLVIISLGSAMWHKGERDVVLVFKVLSDGTDWYENTHTM